jgi:hypothetical protein
VAFNPDRLGGVDEGDGKKISALFESSSCVLPIEGLWCAKSRRGFSLQVLRTRRIQPFVIKPARGLAKELWLTRGLLLCSLQY